MRIQTPREISSAGQGALTPSTARLVAKSAVEHIGAATPMGDTSDAARTARTPWANLTVDTSLHTDSTIVQQPQATAIHAEGASTHVSQQPGLLPERYTADLTHWQSPVDLPERRLMVQRIIAMTRTKRVDATGLEATGSATATCADRTPSLAKRIELSLYSRAASFSEYRDLNTLRRRLQSLVSLSFHEAAAARRATQTTGMSKHTMHAPRLGKRKLGSNSSTRLGNKRYCAANDHALTKATVPSTTHDRALFFSTSDDVLQLIFAFVGGVDTLRCCSINSFAATRLPLCVQSLALNVATLARGFAAHSVDLLCRFPNLQTLTLSACAPQQSQQSQSCMHSNTNNDPSLHAWSCVELAIAHDNAGEAVVQQLADALERGACRRLVHLELVSVFTNTCRGNALHVLCRALVKGACPTLEALLLGGNGVSDVGTVDVAWLLASGSLPHLRQLDLRRNYIGASGVERVMAALATGNSRKLQSLCLGGNILTDNCVSSVVRLLARATCPHLRFLGLEDNFLSGTGVHCILQAAVAGGMMPKLHHVSSDGRGGNVTESDVEHAAAGGGGGEEEMGVVRQ